MPDTITIKEIDLLFKKHLGIAVNSWSTLYHYIKTKNFPNHNGWGRPRQFCKKKVIAWFKKNARG